MSNSKRNFYDMLNATSSASFDELKLKYKQLILQCHPDKLRQQLEISDDPNNSEFVAITEAWNCLKDPVKRKQYDAEQLLKKFHTHNNIYAHIKLSEMKKQPNTEEYFEVEEVDIQACKEECTKDGVSKYIYTYDCRCGGQYIVDESAEQYCRPANNPDTQIISSDNNGVHDDADNKTTINGISSSSSMQNNKKSPNNVKNTNTRNAGGSNSSGSSSSSSCAGGSEGVVLHNADDDGVDVDVDEEGGGELIVECSECSLVIILNG